MEKPSSEQEQHKRRRLGSVSSIELQWDGSTIELQNLGDAQLCRDVTAHLEHAFSGRQGEWRVARVDCRIASG